VLSSFPAPKDPDPLTVLVAWPPEEVVARRLELAFEAWQAAQPGAEPGPGQRPGYRMCPVGADLYWKDSARLADGREIIYYDESPGLGRAKAPDLPWIESDLVDLGAHVAPRTVHLAVLAGNIFLFVDPGTEAAVVAQVATALRPDGMVVAGFQVRPGGYGPDALDADARAAGLTLVHRWSTWDRRPWSPGGDYQVSVHRRQGSDVVDPTPRG